MKKLVLAVLLAGLATTATAQVVLSGKLATTLDRNEVGSVAQTRFANDPTSNITISAKEQIGTVGFRAVIETSLFGNSENRGTETRLGDRQRTVGFTTKAGGLDFGRNVHSHFLNVTIHDPFSTVYGSIAPDIHPLHGLRFSNGVFAHAHVAKNAMLAFERTQGDVQETTVMAASGSVGPVRGMVSHYERGADKSLVIGAGATVVGNRLTATWSDNKGVGAHKGATVNAQRDLGPITVKASYGKTNTDTKAYALGAVYNFSKRTEVGVAYRNVDTKSAATDISQIGVGITHRF